MDCTKDIRDLYIYQLTNKISCITPIDKVIKTALGEGNLIDKVVMLLKDNVDSINNTNYLSPDFYKLLEKEEEEIVSKIQKGNYDVDGLICIFKLAPNLKKRQKVKEYILKAIYLNVENVIGEYNTTIFYSYIDNEIDLEDVRKIIVIEDKKQKLSLIHCCGKYGVFLEDIIEEYGIEILKAHKFIKVTCGRVSLYAGVEYGNLEEKFIESNMFTEDLIEYYSMFGKGFDYLLSHKEEILKYEENHSKNETIYLCYYLRKHKQQYNEAIRVIEIFLENKDLDIKNKAIECILKFPLGYKALLDVKYSKDKEVQKELKKMYYSGKVENFTGDEYSYVKEWCENTKRKLDFNISYICENTKDINIIYSIKELFTKEKLKKFISVVEGIALNEDERILSVLHEIKINNKSEDVSDRIGELLEFIEIEKKQKLEKLLENSIARREDNSFSKKYKTFIDRNYKKPNKNRLKYSSVSAEKLLDLKGKTTNWKNVKNFYNDSGFKCISKRWFDDVLYTEIFKELNIVALIEISAFSTIMYDWMSSFPEEMLNIEILDISFYNYNGENLDTRYFIENNKLEIENVQRNVITDIYKKITRYFK